MRFPFASLATSALLLPFTLAAASQQPLQIYLHPAPPSPAGAHHTAPTLTASQAKAVLAHHLGEGLPDFEEIPADEGLWSHLMAVWGGASTEKEWARVVVIDGGVSPQDVLPTTLKTPAFYLSDDASTHHLLSPYVESAKNLLAHILDAIPAFAKSFKDVFDLAGTKAAAALSHELSCLTALADSIPWLDHSGSYPWEAITISGLKGVTRNDDVWETGRQGVKAGLESMTAPGSPPLLLIIRPTSSRPLSGRALPVTLHSQANTSLAATCYSSNETCSDATSCNGRGACALKLTSGDGECWGCKCANGYAGVECQKEDYSVPFIIIVFSTVLLLGLAVGSVGLLYTVGESKLPSTLTLAVGGAMKRD